jgi:hypothetical protein
VGAVGRDRRGMRLLLRREGIEGMMKHGTMK